MPLSKTTLPAFCVVFAAAAVSQAQTPPASPPRDLVITNATVMTVTHGTLEHASVWIHDGKIAGFGATADGLKGAPADAVKVDATGKYLTPGIVDPHSHSALDSDVNEATSPVTPSMMMIDAFDNRDKALYQALAGGVTTELLLHGSANMIGGQAVVIKNKFGLERDAMLFPNAPRSIKFASGENPKRVYGSRDQLPSTRMGNFEVMRQAFEDGKAYMAKWDAYNAKVAKGDKDAEKPAVDLKLEALQPYLRGERPVVLAAYEGYEIEVAMQIAQEFHLKVVLNHLTHGQEILDKIASYKVPVIVGPIYDFPSANERYDSVFTLPAELYKRGVKIAFSSAGGSSGNPGGFERNLPYAAGYSVAYGLPYDEALKAITLNPAEIWGVADQLGSLDPGKTANIVIANGDPLDVRTDVKQIYIQGHAIPMESRQTKLRDEYSK